MKHTNIRPNILWTSILFGMALVIFTYTYYYEPLSESYSPYINDKVLDVLTLTPALMAAIIGALITSQFERSEPPFRVWLTFTIGWWFWVGGELLGFLYDIWYPDFYPEFSWIDVCWLGGYFFFGLTLYYQFRLIYTAKEKRNSWMYFAYIMLGLLLTYGLTELAIYAGLGADASSWWVIYLSVLYPVFDLTEGGAALWLSLTFGRGTLGKAWWGLIAFAVADSINIFFWLGGYEWISDQAYYVWDTFSSVAYITGYMITTLAFLAAYNLLRYGVAKRQPPTTAN